MGVVPDDALQQHVPRARPRPTTAPAHPDGPDHRRGAGDLPGAGRRQPDRPARVRRRPRGGGPAHRDRPARTGCPATGHLGGCRLDRLAPRRGGAVRRRQPAPPRGCPPVPRGRPRRQHRPDPHVAVPALDGRLAAAHGPPARTPRPVHPDHPRRGVRTTGGCPALARDHPADRPVRTDVHRQLRAVVDLLRRHVLGAPRARTRALAAVAPRPPHPRLRHGRDPGHPRPRRCAGGGGQVRTRRHGLLRHQHRHRAVLLHPAPVHGQGPHRADRGAPRRLGPRHPRHRLHPLPRGRPVDGVVHRALRGPRSSSTDSCPPGWTARAGVGGSARSSSPSSAEGTRRRRASSCRRSP